MRVFRSVACRPRSRSRGQVVYASLGKPLDPNSVLAWGGRDGFLEHLVARRSHSH